MINKKQIAVSFSLNIHIQCLVYLPEEYRENKKKYPLVLFLHGSGERGENVELFKKNGLPKLAEEEMGFPFIIVSPQCPAEESWSVPVLKILLDEIEKKYRVDTRQEYVTGLSMGGFGAWKIAIAMPEKFAAVIPICGGGDPKRVSVLKNVPVWVFHGKQDKIVPIEKAKNMVRALKKAGGDVRFTIYPEAGHDVWTQTYKNHRIYTWMLNHRLPVFSSGKKPK